MRLEELSDVPAIRLQQVAWLLHPVDPETGEELQPAITLEDALRLLEMPTPPPGSPPR